MKISVVITAYNVEPFISTCINSVLKSEHEDLEVVVVEDCSTDNTKERIEEIEDKRIKVVYNEENVGAGMSRRIGIQNSTGDYVITVDGDDYVAPEFIGDLAKCAEETKADIVSGGITVLRDEKVGAYDIYCYGNRIVTGPEKITEFFGEKIVFLNNKIVKRELYDTVPYSSRRFIEDTPTVAPLLYLAKSTAYVNTVGYIYRQHPSSLCHQSTPFKNTLYRALCAKDLYNWFKDKEEVYKGMFGISLFLEWAQKLSQIRKTDEDIKKYQAEWNEYSLALLDVLSTLIWEKASVPHK